MSGDLFHGIIFNAESPGARVGTMQDVYGKSGLSEISLTGRKLTFIKKYDDGREFRYTFYNWHDNIWVGRFTGGRGGGQAFCILTEIDSTLHGRDVGQVRANLQRLFQELALADSTQGST